MTVTTVYTALAHASGPGRDGTVRTDDDVLTLRLRSPLELGGEAFPGGADEKDRAVAGPNPEQLLASGFGASFLEALHAAGRHLGRATVGAQVSCEVGVCPDGNGGLRHRVTLYMHVPGLAGSERQDLIDLARAVCPFVAGAHDDVGLTVIAVD